jgi:hypothetical protein
MGSIDIRAMIPIGSAAVGQNIALLASREGADDDG